MLFSSLFFTLLSLLGGGYMHQCGHDYLVKKRGEKRVELERIEKRVLGGTRKSTHAFRFMLSYTKLDQFVSNYPSLAAKSALSKRVFSRIQTYFQNFITTNYYDTSTFGFFICDTTTSSGITFTADYYAFVEPEVDSSAPYFAAAAACVFDANDKRPVIGQYILNFAYMSEKKRDEYVYFYVFLHEAMHLLGFSPDSYSSYMKSGGGTYGTSATKTKTIGSSTFTELAYPNLVSFAKSYYGSTSTFIDGVLLENGGGSGSSSAHWEKTYYPNEFMNPSTEEYPIISDFTMETLRATGWYTVSTQAAMEYTWGKGQGDSFFSTCPTGRGYCQASNLGQDFCSMDYRTKGVCSTYQTFYEGCNLIRDTRYICELTFDADVIDKDSVEIYGPTSRCFEWINIQNPSFNLPKCQKAACINGNQVQISVNGGYTFTCNQGDTTVRVDSSYSIKCPDVTDFCSRFNQKCSDDCYRDGAGICLKGGNCFCFNGKKADGTCNPDAYFTTGAIAGADSASSKVYRPNNGGISDNSFTVFVSALVTITSLLTSYL